MAQPTSTARTARTDDAPEPKPASVLKERWTQWVALTTTVLAVCAAISSLKAGGYATKVQVATTRENDKWAQYQAKSIKQNLYSVEHDLLEVQALEVRSPEAQRAAQAQLAKISGEIERYDREKGQLRGEAEAIQKEEARYQRTAASFGLAVMLLQIAIMLSSVGALIKRPVMWLVGLCFGLVGLAFMGSGFFGWF